MENLLRGKKLLIIPLTIFIISLLYIIIFNNRKDESIITGEIEVRQIDISAKIAGRIDTIYVKEGDKVKKGDIIARLYSPEISAKYEQAKSAVNSAKALLDMAINGARKQDIKAAFEMYEAARAQFEFAEKSYNRLKKLYQEEVISKQMLDEAEYKYNAANSQMIAAKQKWEMAKEGARKEEIDAAQGNYERALNSLKEVEVYLDETKIKAPKDGEVDNILVDEGEMIAAGYPILSIIDLNDNWATFYISELFLNKIKKDQEYDIIIPALNNQKFKFKVNYISVLGDFATKKATNEQGSFDLKSFEVHLVPVNQIPDLRPGMSCRLIAK